MPGNEANHAVDLTSEEPIEISEDEQDREAIDLTEGFTGQMPTPSVTNFRAYTYASKQMELWAHSRHSKHERYRR